jgi:hypothetical protein
MPWRTIRVSCEVRPSSRFKNYSYPRNRLQGLQGSDMLRIPHYFYNRLTDGNETVNFTHRPRLTQQKHFYFSGTHLYQRLTESQSLMRLGGLGKLLEFIYLIESLRRDFPTYSTVRQLLRYSEPHNFLRIFLKLLVEIIKSSVKCN